MDPDHPAVYALECHEPGLLWFEFFQAVGPEELKASFDWQEPPTGPRAHERVWRVFDVAGPRWQVGWFAIRLHPCDVTVGYLIRGVFPSARRKGYRVSIGEVAVQEAKAMGLQRLIIEILDTNPTHLQRHLRESRSGDAWIYSGHHWFPAPETHVFTRLL